MKNLSTNPSKDSKASYLGMLRWGNARKLIETIEEL